MASPYTPEEEARIAAYFGGGTPAPAAASPDPAAHGIVGGGLAGLNRGKR